MKRLLLCLIFICYGIANGQEDLDIELFASGFTSPLNIQNAGDTRLFIVEQGGTIQIVDTNGNTNSSPFLDISSQISTGGERGLLGLAFHPDYQTNGLFYVYYTNSSGDSVLSEFSVDSGNPDIADANSETVMLTITQPFSNHNGGCIAFGPDGMLYVATGDGGSGGDPNDNAQNLTTLLGKLLRLDVDIPAPYIPSDNPFVNDNNAEDEIYAYGLRNPWKFSFDAENGELWIADVGQNEFEEINKVSNAEAANFGWRCYEASTVFDTSGNCPSQNEITFPFAEYSHTNSGANKCSITGGYVYRGTEFSNLIGKYIFADFCSDEIATVDANGNISYFGPFSGNSFASFGQDINGNLYVAGIGSGDIYKVVDQNLSVNSSEKIKISVYPNPTNGQLSLKSNELIQKVELFSMLGQKISEIPVHKKETIISVNNLSAGNYFLKITGAQQQQYTKQFIIN
ncbi:PQQ-dependent sugar dehydrogenase [Mesonia maritima]|uniref:Glucose/arabinose dehydrogenase n=1 Tax=Mesonia maritima TaxID=1793873 RepID=A0ABU1K6Z2_9FLAO|nr:PQQ-dependent sugar dehydrogenase [Mesonia maritima]MDR6300343.1 glucose/arabinose dehydrogenase [Mesonia maritima]